MAKLYNAFDGLAELHSGQLCSGAITEGNKRGLTSLPKSYATFREFTIAQYNPPLPPPPPTRYFSPVMAQFCWEPDFFSGGLSSVKSSLRPWDLTGFPYN